MILVAVVGTTLSVKPALATLTVSESRYAAGVLVVRGETRTPSQRIGLDNRYFTKADKRGQFLFRIRIQYLPHDCTIRLDSKDIQHLTVVEGCLP